MHQLTVSRATTTFSNIYGITSSTSYSLTITFAQAQTSSQTITIKTSASQASITGTLAAQSTTLTLKIPLVSSNSNTISITNGPSVSSIKITNPTGTFYPSKSFTLAGGATLDTCSTGCTPSGSKIGSISPASSATIQISRSAASTAGLSSTAKYVEIVYTNNDVALDTAWGEGRNGRNVTVAVNGAAPARLEVPLSGRSSELFSAGKGWYDSATLGVLVDGWGSGDGTDRVVIGAVNGVQTWAPDVVGIRVF